MDTFLSQLLTHQFAAAHQLLEEHPELLNQPDHHQNTPLHHAITYESISAAQFLLERGANVNLQNHLGHTPLMRLFDNQSMHPPPLLEAFILLLIAYPHQLNLADKEGRHLGTMIQYPLCNYMTLFGQNMMDRYRPTLRTAIVQFVQRNLPPPSDPDP